MKVDIKLRSRAFFSLLLIIIERFLFKIAYKAIEKRYFLFDSRLHVQVRAFVSLYSKTRAPKTAITINIPEFRADSFQV